MIDVVLKSSELVEAIVVQHQCFINILLLVEEEHPQASSKELLRLLIKIVRPTLLIRLSYDLNQSFSHRDLYCIPSCTRLTE